MQNQINLQPYLITSSIIFKYEGKKLISFASSRDRLVFLTQTHIHIIDPTIPKHKATASINSENILRYALSCRNQICILYNNGTMEIRMLESISVVLHLFKDVEIKGGRNFPQLYWNTEDIYVLTDTKLELFNIPQKIRKVYSHADFIGPQDAKNLLGLVQSRLLDRQRIVIMQFVDKISFNIVPLAITYMPIQNITKFLSLFSHKHQITPGRPPLQYLALIIDNKILKIYNIINMKQLLEIQYEKTAHQNIDISTDMTREFLLVTFTTKKNKVTRNILYKINTQDYYHGNYGQNYLKEGQKFFEYQIELEVKQKLIIFQPKQIVLENKKFLAVHIGHIRHYAKRSKGEVVLSTLIVNQPYVKNLGITKCKTKAPQWKQLRQWKEIITSYIDMKNTLDMMEFNFGSDEERGPEKVKKKNNLPNQSQKAKQALKESQRFHEINNKIIRQEQHNELSQQQEKMEIQMNRFEKLKTSLIDGAQLFKNKILSMRNHEEEHTKLEQQFYHFIREYLKDQDVDFDVEMLFQKMEQKSLEGQLALQLLQPSEEADEGSLIDSKQTREEKFISISKSSQKLRKNTEVPNILSRTKSSTKEEFQANSENKLQNASITSSFSERKLEVVTKSQENLQNDEQVDDQDYDEMARKITEAIVKAFQPLQKKLDNLSERLDRTQSIHVAQLKKCQRATQTQVNYIKNIDMTIKGYCQELLMQFDKNLQSGLRSYWLKIQEIDKKAARDRDKAINIFGGFIDQQIKSRADIFDDNRFCIENSLIHLRRKLVNLFTQQEELDDKWELSGCRKSFEEDFDLDPAQQWDDDSDL